MRWEKLKPNPKKAARKSEFDTKKKPQVCPHPGYVTASQAEIRKISIDGKWAGYESH